MVSLVSDGNGGVMRDQFGQPMAGGYTGAFAQFQQSSAPPPPVDPYAAVRAQLAAQRAKFNPNYMQSYTPPAQPTIQRLAGNPMVQAYNAMHGYNNDSGVLAGGQFMGGSNPLVAAYNAAHGYK
jgi:hypothetical protein